jgi:hypothetical protein
VNEVGHKMWEIFVIFVDVESSNDFCPKNHMSISSNEFCPKNRGMSICSNEFCPKNHMEICSNEFCPKNHMAICSIEFCPKNHMAICLKRSVLSAAKFYGLKKFLINFAAQHSF